MKTLSLILSLLLIPSIALGTGETNFPKGVTAGGTTKVTLSSSGNATVGGNATVTGTLGVTSNATVGGTLGITGATTATDLTATGAARIGSSGSADTKSVLDLVSTTKGFLPPRMTQTQRDAISSPTTGLVVYNTTTNKVNAYNGSNWVEVGGGAGGLYAGGQNLITNNSFETDVTSNITTSGGTATRTTSAGTFMEPGTAALSWDSSAAAQTVSFNSVTIGGTASLNLTFSCAIKAASGTATHVLEVYDGTNVVASQAITSSTSQFIRTTIAPFSAASSGTYTARIKSVASNEPAIYVDDCYFGQADGFNLLQVSQASLYGAVKYTGKASCDWSTTSATFAAFAADTDCSTVAYSGNAGSPGSLIPGLTFSSLPAGEYYVVMNGLFTTGSSTSCDFQFYDGSTYSGAQEIGSSQTAGGLAGRFSYSSAQGSTTFQVRGRRNTGAAGCDIYNADTAQNFEIQVYYFPSGTSLAYKPSASSFLWQGYHDANCDFTTTSGSYVLPTGDASCTFAEVTNINAGSVVSQTNGGNNSSGVSWTPNAIGQYKVCAEFTAYDDTASATVNANLYDSVDGLGPTQNYRAPVSGGYVAPFNLCRILNVTSLATRTEEIRMAVGSNTGHITAIGFTGDHAIWWTIEKSGQNMAVPVLIGSVTTNATGSERIERARIDNSAGAGTITSQSGSWVTRNTSSTGDVTLDITAGLFSAAPTCTCSVESDNTTTVCIQATTPTTTQLRFRTYRSATGSDTVGNKAFDIICVGPR